MEKQSINFPELNNLSECEPLMDELKELTKRANVILTKVKNNGVSICINETYTNPKDENELVAPQISMRFFVGVCI